MSGVRRGERPGTSPAPPATLRRGWGRTLVFVYGVFAVAATARSGYQLATRASEAPLPYALSALAAVVYVVATWALAREHRRVAWAAVLVELVGVLVVGATSLLLPQDYPDATVWSGFGVGYGYVPLLLPLLGLAWLWHTSPGRATTVGSRD